MSKEKKVKCPACGGDAFLYNPKYKIYQCKNWEKGTCGYGCFFEEDGK